MNLKRVVSTNRECYGYNQRPLAMVYVRNQPWEKIYKPEVALMRGTLFNELDKPFKWKGDGCNER